MKCFPPFLNVGILGSYSLSCQQQQKTRQKKLKQTGGNTFYRALISRQRRAQAEKSEKNYNERDYLAL